MMIFHSYVSLPEGNPLKNMTSSDWIIIPTIEENKKMFQTTNQMGIRMDSSIKSKDPSTEWIQSSKLVITCGVWM
jgi:hypothetical protein